MIELNELFQITLRFTHGFTNVPMKMQHPSSTNQMYTERNVYSHTPKMHTTQSETVHNHGSAGNDPNVLERRDE